jgi:hypothetical protein
MSGDTPRDVGLDPLARRGDDFTRIAGIGPIVAAQLHASGIYTFAQLGALSPAEVVARAENLPLLTPEQIVRQDWAGQARRLAAEAQHLIAPDPSRRYATFSVELMLGQAGQVQGTRVVHVQGGEEHFWHGWDEAELREFLGGFAVLPDMAASLTLPEVATPLHLEVVGVTVYEPEPTPALHEAAPRLAARIELRLSGSDSQGYLSTAPWYIVQLIACDLASGRSAVLGVRRGRLAAGQATLAPHLEFQPPDDGKYQLIGVALLPHEALVGYVLGPVLHVETV